MGEITMERMLSLFRRTTAALPLLAVGAFFAAGAQADAAAILYGNFNAPNGTVTFQAVTESSGTDAVPLYGPPTPFNVGLDFDPMSFVSAATGGSADVTDGQLNTTLQGNGPSPSTYTSIDSIDFSEAGDFTLVGTGTATTSVSAGIIARIKITQVDGVNLVTPVTATVNASFATNLVASPGTSQPWTLGSSIDVDAVLTANNISYVKGATKVEVVTNDTLTSISEQSTVAFIAKKDFVITLGTTPVPEPTTAALLVLTIGGFSMRRRRFN